tara:strand:- start:1877 stop:2737 length:861 start_codon:yes stop_codon:yes gene_type:complete
MKIPYILTEESLTVVVDGKAMTMQKDHPAWTQAIDALNNEEYDRLENLFDVSKAVADYVDDESGISVREGTVFFQDEPIHNTVVDKILSFMRQGLPFKPLVRFLGKLMANPSRRAVNELYTFLEHKSMPITPNGNFVAYKGVTKDFKDFHTGKFDNSIGQTLSMVRNSVCDDANIGCSYGFHAGSYEYAKGYASNGGHLLRVEIDPTDVVSVPLDCSCQKLRTAKYKVIALHESIERPLDDGIYGEYDEDDWDDSGDTSDSESFGNGWDAGYKQAQKDMLDNLKNN